MITQLKKPLEPFIAIIAKPFLFIHPNIITILGLVFPILFCILLVSHHYTGALISGFGFIFDALDGFVARQQQKASPFGEILDATVDRISDGIVLSSFGFGSLVPWNLVIGVLISTYLISFIKARGEAATKIVIRKGIMQRSERLLFLFLLLFLYIVLPISSSIPFLTIGFGMLFLLNSVTILQRLVFYYKTLR